MKRLFTLLLTCAVVALSAIAQDFERFAIEQNGIKYYSAWLEVNNAHLDVQIPPAQVQKRWGADWDEPVTLREFTLAIHPSINSNKSVILLSAPSALGLGYRNGLTTEDDLLEWNKETLPFGYTVDDFLTNDEAKLLMGSE